MDIQKGGVSLTVNAAFFLTPKHDVAFLYHDCTLRQGLEKMRSSGYTAIPVIKRDGTYVGIAREGDFLWHIIEKSDDGAICLRDLENVRLPQIMQTEKFPAARITSHMEELLEYALVQNFVPIVDDENKFIGIVTRHRIMKYLTGQQGIHRETIAK